MVKEPNMAEAVTQAKAESELVAVSQLINSSPEGPVRAALGDVTPRSLSKDEIARLQANGNVAEDWSGVMVAPSTCMDRIRGSSFFGKVVMGPFAGKVDLGGVELPTGVYGCTVADSCIGADALVKQVGFLAKCVVKERAVVFGCGLVAGEEGAEFGNGGELPIGIETGGRDTLIYAEMDVTVAEKVGRLRGDKALLAAYEKGAEEYVDAARCDVMVIGEGARVVNTPHVCASFIGPGAIIDGAGSVTDSTILSNADEQTEISRGAHVSSSLIQWGCEVTTMALVDTSLMTEHSHVERHGKVTESILGPNTGVAEGELTASLLGPFVGFHHQSLLIAVFWPEGKGNVAYGANVGSNHTSRAPDQEMWPGEGPFFGMGCNVKFPADFSSAPYSIIATSVTTLPQKVTFPFSLINTPATTMPGVSPAFNEIMPAWVLGNNMFMLMRNEGKYKARNKARRTQFVFDVFRPDTVGLMLDARDRLRDVKEAKEMYTSRDIRGLGKNYLLERSRNQAVEAYTYYARRYALLGLEKKVAERLAAGQKDKVGGLLGTPATDMPWEHQRGVLAQELPENDVAANLRLLRDVEEEVAKQVQLAKEKDDERGGRILDDYAEAHEPAADNSFVREVWEKTRALHAEIDDLLGQL